MSGADGGIFLPMITVPFAMSVHNTEHHARGIQKREREKSGKNKEKLVVTCKTRKQKYKYIKAKDSMLTKKMSKQDGVRACVCVYVCVRERVYNGGDYGARTRFSEQTLSQLAHS